MVMTTFKFVIILHRNVTAAGNDCSSACNGHGSTGLVCMHIVNLHLSWQLAMHFNTASD